MEEVKTEKKTRRSRDPETLPAWAQHRIARLEGDIEYYTRTVNALASRRSAAPTVSETKWHAIALDEIEMIENAVDGKQFKVHMRSGVTWSWDTQQKALYDAWLRYKRGQV